MPDKRPWLALADRVAALEAENARLRAALERAEVVLRALCDDHVRTEMRAHGRSVGDTLAARAREALEPPVEGVPGLEGGE